MPRLLITVAVIVWLVLLSAAYGSLFLFPAPPNVYSQAPSPPDLSAAYLPLLAALLIPGIIRRLARIRGVPPGDGDR